MSLRESIRNLLRIVRDDDGRLQEVQGELAAATEAVEEALGAEEEVKARPKACKLPTDTSVARCSTGPCEGCAWNQPHEHPRPASFDKPGSDAGADDRAVRWVFGFDPARPASKAERELTEVRELQASIERRARDLEGHLSTYAKQKSDLARANVALRSRAEAAEAQALTTARELEETVESLARMEHGTTLFKRFRKAEDDLRILHDRLRCAEDESARHRRRWVGAENTVSDLSADLDKAVEARDLAIRERESIQNANREIGRKLVKVRDEATRQRVRADEQARIKHELLDENGRVCARLRTSRLVLLGLVRAVQSGDELPEAVEMADLELTR